MQPKNKESIYLILVVLVLVRLVPEKLLLVKSTNQTNLS
jgi:hypothetical protein